MSLFASHLTNSPFPISSFLSLVHPACGQVSGLWARRREMSEWRGDKWMNMNGKAPEWTEGARTHIPFLAVAAEPRQVTGGNAFIRYSAALMNSFLAAFLSHSFSSFSRLFVYHLLPGIRGRKRNGVAVISLCLSCHPLSSVVCWRSWDWVSERSEREDKGHDSLPFLSLTLYPLSFPYLYSLLWNVGDRAELESLSIVYLFPLTRTQTRSGKRLTMRKREASPNILTSLSNKPYNPDKI